MQSTPDRFLLNHHALLQSRALLLYNKYIDLIWSLRVIRRISTDELNYSDAKNVNGGLGTFTHYSRLMHKNIDEESEDIGFYPTAFIVSRAIMLE